LVHLGNEPSILQRENKNYHDTKNWKSKVGLSKFPNNMHEAFLLTNERFPRKNFNIQEKIMLELSQKLIDLLPFLCIDKYSVVLFT
jgi:hypothetical protein